MNVFLLSTQDLRSSLTRKVSIKRLCAGLLMLALSSLLPGCGGGNSSPTDAANPLSAALHSQAVANTKVGSPLLFSSVRTLSDGSYSSQAKSNGRVVDIFPRWTTEAGGENEAIYVLYSFLSDTFLKSGALGSPSTNVVSEIWRYTPRYSLWCPIVAGSLPFSVTAVSQLSRSGPPKVATNADPVRLLVGTADGVLGQISFVDTAPDASTCNSTTFTPAPGSDSFYSVLMNSRGVGGITQMKLVDVQPPPGSDPAKNVFADTKLVYTWGGAGCALNSEVDADGSCTTQKVQPLMYTPVRISAGTVADAALPVFVPMPAGFSQDPRADVSNVDNQVIGLDVRAQSNASDDQVDLVLAASFSGGANRVRTAAWSSPVGTAPNYYVRGQVPAFVDRQGYNDLPGPRRGESPAFVNLTADAALSPSTAKVQFIYPSPGSDIYGKMVNCSFNSPSTCHAVATLSGGGTSFPAGPNFLPVPYQAAPVNWKTGLDPSSYLNTSLPLVGGAHLVNSPAPGLTWGNSLTSTITDHAMTGSPQVSPNFLNTAADGTQSLILSNARALLVPSFDGQRVRAYLMASTIDLSPLPGGGQTSSAGQLLKGGLSLCVLTFADSRWDYSACDSARPQADGEAADGYVLADATTMFGDNRYMVAPHIVRFSVAPSGAVLVYAANRPGRIARINASAGNMDWQSTSNSWSTISGGRLSTCTDVLNKPAMPPKPSDPPQKLKDKFWFKSMLTTVFASVSVGLEIGFTGLGNPELGLFVSGLVDEGVGLVENYADQRDKKAIAPDGTYEQWVDVYSKVDITTACKLGD